MIPTPAKITLHTLTNSDGSALYVSPNATHTLQAAVHYPLEVPYRSEEAPADTYFEVSLRPHNGVTTVKERHIEEVVRKVLKDVVLGEETPRSMLQCTIQTMEVEADEELSGGVKGGGQGEGYQDTLVGAVNTSVLACLDGGVQMKGLVGAVLIGITKNREVRVSPTVRERKKCASLHVFGFDSRARCVLMESEGHFDVEDWQMAEQAARGSVCGRNAGLNGVNGDAQMSDSEIVACLFDIMRRSVEDRVTREQRWKP